MFSTGVVQVSYKVSNYMLFSYIVKTYEACEENRHELLKIKGRNERPKESLSPLFNFLLEELPLENFADLRQYQGQGYECEEGDQVNE